MIPLSDLRNSKTNTESKENAYLGVFGDADYDSGIRFVKFRMAHSI